LQNPLLEKKVEDTEIKYSLCVIDWEDDERLKRRGEQWCKYSCQFCGLEVAMAMKTSYE
jgi:hypothetical protein